MATYSNTAREVEMPNGDVVVLHSAPTGGENTTSNIKKFKYDDNGHVTESEAADAEDLNLSGYSTPTTGSTDIGASDDIQTAIGKLDHQSHTNQTNILYGLNMGVKNWFVVPNGNYSSAAGGAESTWEFTDGECKVVTCTTNDTRAAFEIAEIKLPAGDYVMTGRHTGACDVRLFKDSTNITTGDVSRFTLSTESVVEVAAYTYGTGCVGTVLKPLLCTAEAYAQSTDYQPPALPNYDLTQGLAELNAHPFLTVPSNHNMVYRGKNLGDTLTADQDTALSSGNFTDLYLGDYWTKSVSIPAGTYTDGGGAEVTVPAQTVTLKAVIADFDTFYAGYASTYAGINTHHAAVIVTGFSNVVWNSTNTTAGGYVASLIHKWLVGSALPQIETWFGSAKVLSHQKLLTNAITGDAASGWAWSSQKISLLSENQMYGSKVWGNSKAANGGYEPGEAFKHLNVFNHIDANLLFGNRNIWLRDIASAVRAALLLNLGNADYSAASHTRIAPAALILLS